MRQIRTLGMLRSRFGSIPLAFNACLIPAEESDAKRKKGLKSYLHSRFEVSLFFFYIFLHCFFIFIGLLISEILCYCYNISEEAHRQGEDSRKICTDVERNYHELSRRGPYK